MKRDKAMQRTPTGVRRHNALTTNLFPWAILCATLSTGCPPVVLGIHPDDQLLTADAKCQWSGLVMGVTGAGQLYCHDPAGDTPTWMFDAIPDCPPGAVAWVKDDPFSVSCVLARPYTSFAQSHGPTIEFHDDGSVLRHGHVARGSYSGRWTTYWPGGEVKRIIEHTDRGSRLEETAWHANGEVFERCAYDDVAQGRGTCERWYDDGQIQSRRPVVLYSYYDGTVTHWYDNGHKQLEEQWSTREEGTGDEWRLLGHGRNGSSMAWHENGQLASMGQYDDGHRTGTWIRWYDNGQKQEEGAYIEDQPHGTFVHWYEDGLQACNVTFVGGRREGKALAWHPGGQLWVEGTYDQGRPAGMWRTAYDSGQLAIEATYDAGVVHGELRRWYADGRLELVARYDQGQRVGTPSCWDDHGDETTCERLPEASSPGPAEGEDLCWGGEDGGFPEEIEADFRLEREAAGAPGYEIQERETE
jgi:antitoxin component YwqK of YwqJK toxin-antitoxin module